MSAVGSDVMAVTACEGELGLVMSVGVTGEELGLAMSVGSDVMAVTVCEEELGLAMAVGSDALYESADLSICRIS